MLEVLARIAAQWADQVSNALDHNLDGMWYSDPEFQRLNSRLIAIDDSVTGYWARRMASRG